MKAKLPFKGSEGENSSSLNVLLELLFEELQGILGSVADLL